VRFTDGTLDVRTLWLSDSATRIGIARGGGREGAEGSNPILPPRGQLTRCFSAVAELLVLYVQDISVVGFSIIILQKARENWSLNEVCTILITPNCQTAHNTKALRISCMLRDVN